MFHHNKNAKILKEGDFMKNTTKQSRFKYLFVAIPVLLCAVIVSLTVFLPKEKTSVSNDTASSQQTEPAASQQGTAQEEKKAVKYRLIYAPQNMRVLTERTLTSRGEDLFNDFSREFISLFEGEDVYFRVTVAPVVFYEEWSQEGYTKEKGEELKNQRIQYVKDLGAKDIVLAPNTTHAYYASLNAEMIKKIDEQGECAMQLVTAPRLGEYGTKVSDYLTYYLENIKEGDLATIRFSIWCEDGMKNADRILQKANVSDEQLTLKEYREEKGWEVDHVTDDKYTIIEGSFSKEQIILLSEECDLSGIGLKGEDYNLDNIKDITIILNVTEDTKLPL